MGSEASCGDVELRIVLHITLRFYLNTFKTVINVNLFRRRKCENVPWENPLREEFTLPGLAFFILISCSGFGIQIQISCHPCTVDK